MAVVCPLYEIVKVPAQFAPQVHRIVCCSFACPYVQKAAPAASVTRTYKAHTHIRMHARSLFYRRNYCPTVVRGSSPRGQYLGQYMEHKQGSWQKRISTFARNHVQKSRHHRHTFRRHSRHGNHRSPGSPRTCHHPSARYCYGF